ncbi:PH domain-containing protein [Nocardioides korecus]
MLLVHPVAELVRYLPALIGVFVLGGSNDGGGGPAWWQVGSVAVPVLLGLLRWATTRFRVTDARVELRRGLLRRAQLSARVDRVRAVELTATPVHRLLGLSRVEIGVGSTTSEDTGFVLDGLGHAEAAALRSALLGRAAGRADASPLPGTAPAAGDTGHAGHTGTDGRPGAAYGAGAPAEEVLLRLDPTWARYAPLTASGNVVVIGLLAGAGQLGDRVGAEALRGAGVLDLLGAASVPVLVLLALGTLLVAGAVVAVLGYLVTNFGLTLSRDAAAGSFHVRRGLLTRTETSLDEDRVRGLEVGEPLGLRLAGAARLGAISTGLDRKQSTGGQLVPPAPRGHSDVVGGALLGDADPLRLALAAHGPAARRRRWLRALVGAAVVPLGLLAAHRLLDLPVWPAVVGLLALPAGAFLAHDRYARLGHGLTRDHLVVRSGSLRARRDVLQLSGIIGWTVRQTWFQRRVGLATVVATTAAGRQAYVVLDVPLGTAVALAHEATPELVAPFLAG